MKNKVALKIIALITVVLIGAVLIWVLTKWRKGSSDDEGDRPLAIPSRVSIQNDESVITIDKSSQAKSGIAVETVKTVSRRKEIRAYGMVLDPQEITNSRNNYVAAKAKLSRSLSSLNVSRKEYERRKALYNDNQNISVKDFQSAEAAFRSDEAETRADKAALSALEDSARQQWGDILAKWIFQASPSFKRLLKLQDVLIQITITRDMPLDVPPSTAMIQTNDKKIVSARFVSQSPRTDPRIQGKSFFYVVPINGANILPGMNVLAFLPVGEEVQGVVVPESGIVWWQGKAWVYVLKDSEHFVRKEVPTDNPVEEGWFVANLFSPQDSIVVQGAQLLLSEEFRSQFQVEEK